VIGGSGEVAARRRDERRRDSALELVLAQGARVPLVGEMTVGRDPASTVVLSDPSVSRRHARISADGPSIEDLGSLAGTYVDGVRVTDRAPLRDGSRLRLGDSELLVERTRAPAEAARTIVVPAGVGPAREDRVRVRPGYALKRLAATEGSRRWVLRDLEGDTFLRFGDDDARLFEQLDGTRTPAELSAEAERRLGPSGPARVARLLADLGERGLLEGSGTPATVEAAQPWYRRALQPRERVVPGVGDLVERLYRTGGSALLTRPVLVALTLLAVSGLGVFAYLVAHRYGTPFVVASKLGLGGLVFLLGRSAVVAVHELAHGLVLASYGRRVERAGFKLLLVFPYAFVDTSQAWFEPRRRRIAISAAGPASDATLGALFSIACLLLAPGTVRDIFFQLAFGAYLGACFNLNPFLDRDGYHILADLLREPNLRRRARASAGGSRVLARYSAFAAGWSVIAALFVVATTLRYRHAFDAVAPAWVVWTVIAAVWSAVLVPVVLAFRPAIAARRG
jgi:pSer/pThr/pTyr-binding forkhead associated (FHA) protein/Zn-dependent protease